MIKKTIPAFLSLALLAGCGSDDKGRPNVSAPVNNIKDQIDTKEAVTKEMQDTAKANAKKANDIMDERWNKKK